MTAPVRGNIRVLREACMCQEDHGEEDESAPCTNHATHELCIEADSFGSDWMPLCESCLEAHKRVVEENGGLTGTCDTCKAEDVIIVPVRDSEEGLHGPVYDLCPTCLEKHKAYEHQMWADTFPNQAAMEDDRDDDDDQNEDWRDDLSEEEFMARLDSDMDDDEEEPEPDDQTNPVFLSNVRKGLTFDFDDLPLIAQDDSHFNLTGPLPIPNFPHLVGFSANWQGQKTILLCVDINTSTAKWWLADGDDRTVRFGALANVINRIRTWGYPVTKAEMVNY